MLCAHCVYFVGMDSEKSSAHNVRFPDKLWADAKTIADARYERLSDVLRRALVEYVEKNS